MNNNTSNDQSLSLVSVSWTFVFYLFSSESFCIAARLALQVEWISFSADSSEMAGTFQSLAPAELLLHRQLWLQ